MLMIFRGFCPNCGGDIDSERLAKGLPCRKCLPNLDLFSASLRGYERVAWVKERLLDNDSLRGYWSIARQFEELRDFEEFFTRLTSFRLWNIQRSWAKRLLNKENFALIAPTGVGKSTLLMTYALYRASKELSKVIFMVPTVELVKQTYSKLVVLNNKLCSEVLIISTTELRGDKKGFILNAMKSKEPSIIVMTNNFFSRNLKSEVVNGGLFTDLLIVDDFDALLKSSKVIDALLYLIGIPEEAVKLAKSIVNLRSELLYYKAVGNTELMERVSSELNELSSKLSLALSKSKLGQLVIASATGRGRGSRTKVLRELLGFELGSITNYLRNIIDLYSYMDTNELINILKKLHKGTLVFVSKGMGDEVVDKLRGVLESNGVRCEVANSRKALDRLRSGAVDVLIGIATYYGILVRGIDEPLRVYNAIFYGIPKFKFDINSRLRNPLFLSLSILELKGKYGYNFSTDLIKLAKRVRRLKPSSLRVLTNALRNGLELDGYLKELQMMILKAIDVVKDAYKELLRSHDKLVIGDSLVINDRKGMYVLIPDVMTYIQASGRTSRLFKGRMTLGLSVVLVDDEELFKIFVKRLSYYLMDVKFRYFYDVDLSSIIKSQINSRCGSSLNERDVSRIKSALIIVESPTKAKTIANMFGKAGKRVLGKSVVYETTIPLPTKDIYVTSIVPSLGHVLDLVTDEGLHGIDVSRGNVRLVYSTIKRCLRCGKQFVDHDRCPYCGSNVFKDSKSVLKVIQKLAQEVDYVFIGTDPDMEGEKIAYDLYLLVKPYNGNILRIEFHEITKKAIVNALVNARSINMSLVNAQVVRRVDDRVVGFELSRHLWDIFGKHWLGAGRVQSPVLKWVVSNYVKYRDELGYILKVKPLKSMPYIRIYVKTKDELNELVKTIENEGVRLIKISDEVIELNPKPPFTTDELLTEASLTLKIPSYRVMKLMQDLFELGLITYHRTDSTYVSNYGIEVAKNYLSKVGMEGLLTPRHWGSVGTHECIRPTRPLTPNEVINFSNLMSQLITNYHLKLYELILRRFIASQMRGVKAIRTKVKLNIGDSISQEVILITKIIDKGFTNIYNPYTVTPEVLGLSKEAVLKPVAIKWFRGSKVSLLKDSDVIKIMKEKGIGRPSTYVKAIRSNIEHGYLIMSKKRNYLIPTKLGIKVNEYLQSNFSKFVSEEATKRLESIIEDVYKGSITPDVAIRKLIREILIINNLRLERSKSEEYLSVLE